MGGRKNFETARQEVPENSTEHGELKDVTEEVRRGLKQIRLIIGSPSQGPLIPDKNSLTKQQENLMLYANQLPESQYVLENDTRGILFGMKMYQKALEKLEGHQNRQVFFPVGDKLREERLLSTIEGVRSILAEFVAEINIKHGIEMPEDIVK